MNEAPDDTGWARMTAVGEWPVSEQALPEGPRTPLGPRPSESRGVWLEIPYPERQSRLLLLFKWLFVWPLWVWVGLYGALATVVSLVGFFAVAFTGRYPPGLFNFVRGYLSTLYRVMAYFPFLLTDRWKQNDSHPVWLHAYPQPRMSRRLVVLVKLPLWVIGAIGTVTVWGFVFAFLFAIPAWFGILFTGRYPTGMFKPVSALLEWSARLTCWQFMFSDSRLMFGETAPVRWLTIGGVALSAVATPFLILFTPSASFGDLFGVGEAEAVVEDFLAAGRDRDLARGLALRYPAAITEQAVDRFFSEDRAFLDGFESVDTEAWRVFTSTTNGRVMRLSGAVRYTSGPEAEFYAELIQAEGSWRLTTIRVSPR